MALQIITLKHKEGEYEGVKYDNYNLLVVDYDTTVSSILFGPDYDILKIKRDVFVNELERNIKRLSGAGIKVAADIEGLYIVPIYNKYAQIQGFNLELPPSDDETVEVTEENAADSSISLPDEKQSGKAKSK